MENQTIQNSAFTKAKSVQETRQDGVVISEKEAEEFRAYKRQKKLDEVTRGIAKSQSSLLGGEDVQRVCERAVRLNQPAVRLPASKLFQAKYYIAGRTVRMDCVVGGNGETATRVKLCETKFALRKGAKEISLVLTPSWLDCCRYNEIRKEIKTVQRLTRRTCLKICVEKVYSQTALSRLARLASELKVQYFSVPYFEGCARLRLDLTGGCKLEVSGVEDLETYKKLLQAGVSRIVTDHAWEIYSGWMRETVEHTEMLTKEEKEEEKPKTLNKLEQALQVESPVVSVGGRCDKKVYTDGKFI